MGPLGGLGGISVARSEAETALRGLGGSMAHVLKAFLFATIFSSILACDPHSSPVAGKNPAKPEDYRRTAKRLSAREIEEFNRNLNGLYFKPVDIPADLDAAFVFRSIADCGLDAMGPLCPGRDKIFQAEVFLNENGPATDGTHIMELTYQKSQGEKPLKYVIRIFFGGMDIYSDSGHLFGHIKILGPEWRKEPGQNPPAGPRPLTPEETEEINQSFSKVFFKPQVIPADPDAAFVFQRMIDCEMDAKGPKCLDRDDLFKTELAIMGDKSRLDEIVLTMDLVYKKPGTSSPLRYVVKIHPLVMDIYSTAGDLLGRIDILERRGEPRLSESPGNLVALYHSAKKVFDSLNDQLKRCRLCEKPYSEKVDARKKVINFLNSMKEKNAIYEEALLVLAVREGTELGDLAGLADEYAGNLPSFTLGRVLVLYHHPNRSELKTDAVKWIEGPNPRSVLGLETLGRATELSLQEELVLIKNVGLLLDPTAIKEMMKRIKMTDDHLEAVYKSVPFPLSIQMIESVSSIKAIETLAKFFASSASEVRYKAARALWLMVHSGRRDLWQVGEKAIEDQLAVERDERVRHALEKGY